MNASECKEKRLTRTAAQQLNLISSMITLDNLEQFTIPIQESSAKKFFTFNNAESPSPEHQDQILPLTKEAANFLWDFESKIRIGSFYPDITRYFKEVKEFKFGQGMESEVKKWLYSRGIPFTNKVFLSFQPDIGLVVTWKMIIHYSSNIFFGQDLIVWDRSINWGLYYDHNDIFYFGKNRIYDGQAEQMKLNDLIREVNKTPKKI
jgi:hypothetical protein